MRISTRSVVAVLIFLFAFAPGGAVLGARAFAEAATTGAPAEAEAEVDHAGDEAEPASSRRAGRYDSGEPAVEGNPYFYRQIALALVIMAAMVGFLAWLIRREQRKS